MDMRVRKKQPLRKSGAMAFAIKQWNKVAPEYKMALTQRKDQIRLDHILKMVDAMESASMDWRDKDVWRGLFRKVGQAKNEVELAQSAKIEERRQRKIDRLRKADPEDPRIAHLESIKGQADFCVTFDWATRLRNIKDLTGLDGEPREVKRQSRSSQQGGALSAEMCA